MPMVAELVVRARVARERCARIGGSTAGRTGCAYGITCRPQLDTPADRWRWNWTPDIWENFRGRSELYSDRTNNEKIPEATEPDPAETTVAPPRVPELPVPAEVTPWGSESTSS